jgi:hypothetical protein
MLSATLTSCSYAYEILAVVQSGRLAFVVDARSGEQPSCLRYIEVKAEGMERARAEPGDDTMRVDSGTFWFESVSYDDDCANRFPLEYGRTLSGAHQYDRGIVKAKPLAREVIYEVSTTTGATGYGGGRFIIRKDGRVENLPPNVSSDLMDKAN